MIIQSGEFLVMHRKINCEKYKNYDWKDRKEERKEQLKQVKMKFFLQKNEMYEQNQEAIINCRKIKERNMVKKG